MEPIIVVAVLGGAVLLLAIVVVIPIYNSLVGKRIETHNAWSQIDVQLKRRYDLIPNLVETVKGYASHEKDTLEKVIQARNAAIGAHGIGEHAAAETMLTGALKSLFAVAEAYPDLKANQNFLGLQEELTSTENKISFARQHYNDVVSQYNTSLQRFPGNMVGGMFGFHPEDFFQIEATERAEVQQAPKVKF